MRILIVDDNPGMRRMVRSLFTGKRYDLQEGTDGSDAITACERIRPDVVLMDVDMRPVDGIEATRRIKERWPDVRVIIVSNYGDKRTRDAAAKAGADAFVEKESLLSLESLVDPAADRPTPTA